MDENKELEIAEELKKLCQEIDTLKTEISLIKDDKATANNPSVDVLKTIRGLIK